MLSESKTTWFADMRQELATILHVKVQDLPPVFGTHYRHHKILKTTIDQDIFRAYPHACLADVHDWLNRYTSDLRYQKRLCFAKNRHDLQGHNVGEISARDSRDARRTVTAFYKQQERSKGHAGPASRQEEARP